MDIAKVKQKIIKAHPRIKILPLSKINELYYDCWITPEGYVIPAIGGHYHILFLLHISDYTIVFKEGWIRCSIHMGNVSIDTYLAFDRFESFITKIAKKFVKSSDVVNIVANCGSETNYSSYQWEDGYFYKMKKPMYERTIKI